MMRSCEEIFFMQQAIAQANIALQNNEVPIGAIIIDTDNRIIGTGYNQIEEKKSQLAHAEIEAIHRAIQAKNDWRLDGCKLFVTIEPCMMCFGLAHLSRIHTVFFGAYSPLFGITDLFDNKAYANHSCIIKGGILQEETALLLKNFFQSKR